MTQCDNLTHCVNNIGLFPAYEQKDCSENNRESDNIFTFSDSKSDNIFTFFHLKQRRIYKFLLCVRTKKLAVASTQIFTFFLQQVS